MKKIFLSILLMFSFVKADGGNVATKDDIKGLSKQIDKRFEQIDKRFDMMQHNMDKRFEQVDKRLEMCKMR